MYKRSCFLPISRMRCSKTMNSLYRLLNPTREDGYSVRGLTIQGVRSYDSNTEQWTTPDAYKGDVDDPMSQRSYMWNNNNPVSYADPTGYSPLNLGMLAEMDGEAYADDVAADGGAVSYAPSTASDSSYVKLQAVGLEAGANAIYYSNDTKDLPADKFMQGVGEMVSSGLKWVGDPLPVTTDSSSVSAHDQYGSSLRITGNANGVDVALSHGANNNINTFISWDGTNKWVQSQVHYPGNPYTSPGELVLAYRIRMTLWGVMTTGEIGESP